MVAQPNGGMGPRLAYIISLYHLVLIVAAGWVALLTYQRKIFAEESPLRQALYSVCFGSLGGTLTASRYVVHAVRSRRYDPARFLWQFMTPVYSAVLAGLSIIIVRGGILTVSVGASLVEPQYSLFVIGFSFVVGFASEVFVKRLIAAAEALLGERGDLDQQEK